MTKTIALEMAAARRWTQADFEEFAEWYSARRRGSHGKTPSGTTLRCKRTWLAQMANLVEAPSQEFLANVTHDRARAEFVLDMVSVGRSSGAVRNGIYALIDFSLFGVANGWISSCAITQTDIPPRNPDPPITVYSQEELETFVTAARGAGLRWWAFLSFLIETGRRVGEALSLEWEWLRVGADISYFELPATKTGPQYRGPLVTAAERRLHARARRTPSGRRSASKRLPA